MSDHTDKRTALMVELLDIPSVTSVGVELRLRRVLHLPKPLYEAKAWARTRQKEFQLVAASSPPNVSLEVEALTRLLRDMRNVSGEKLL